MNRKAQKGEKESKALLERRPRRDAGRHAGRAKQAHAKIAKIAKKSRDLAERAEYAEKSKSDLAPGSQVAEHGGLGKEDPFFPGESVAPRIRLQVFSGRI